MLPSDGGICAGATGRRQANHMCFQSWFHHFTVEYRVNIEKKPVTPTILKNSEQIQSSPQGCLWFTANNGEGCEYNQCHMTC